MGKIFTVSPLPQGVGCISIRAMKHLALALVAPLALAACMTTQTETAPAAGEVTPSACGAQDYLHLMGQPATVLEGMALPEANRILRPGQPMTMDLRQDRINFIIDDAGKIENIYCA